MASTYANHDSKDTSNNTRAPSACFHDPSPPHCSSEQGTRRDQQEELPPKLIPPEQPPSPPGWLPELGAYQAELDWQADVLAARGLASCTDAAARKAARFAHSHPGRRRSSVCSEDLGSYYSESDGGSDFSQADSDCYDSDCDGVCKLCGEGLYADDDDILFCREDGCMQEWRRALEEETSHNALCAASSGTQTLPSTAPSSFPAPPPLTQPSSAPAYSPLFSGT
eukprot:3934018-Rhodomonas_salina.1